MDHTGSNAQLHPTATRGRVLGGAHTQNQARADHPGTRSNRSSGVSKRVNPNSAAPKKRCQLGMLRLTITLTLLGVVSLLSFNTTGIIKASIGRKLLVDVDLDHTWVKVVSDGSTNYRCLGDPLKEGIFQEIPGDKYVDLEGWTVSYDPSSKRLCYHTSKCNKNTQVSQWHFPAMWQDHNENVAKGVAFGFGKMHKSLVPLPEGWEAIFHSKENKHGYHHRKTKQAQWELPVLPKRELFSGNSNQIHLIPKLPSTKNTTKNRWIALTDSDTNSSTFGKTYYQNADSPKTAWDLPPGGIVVRAY